MPKGWICPRGHEWDSPGEAARADCPGARWTPSAWSRSSATSSTTPWPPARADPGRGRLPGGDAPGRPGAPRRHPGQRARADGGAEGKSATPPAGLGCRVARTRADFRPAPGRRRL